ncbi:hypothetical protein MCEMIH15_01188 [Caulobacteraceae bacterium]
MDDLGPYIFPSNTIKRLTFFDCHSMIAMFKPASFQAKPRGGRQAGFILNNSNLESSTLLSPEVFRIISIMGQKDLMGTTSVQSLSNCF